MEYIYIYVYTSLIWDRLVGIGVQGYVMYNGYEWDTSMDFSNEDTAGILHYIVGST